MKWKNDIEENVRSGIVELLILHLLSEQDMYGYQIRQELDHRTGGAFQVKEGSLYGPLYRMHERGLISSHRELAGEKRMRNYYHIEAAGRAYLEYGVSQISIVFAGVEKLLNYQKDTENE